jgi:hypothetical protein
MNRERAETFLRLLAEAELRAAAGDAPVPRAPWSADSPSAGFPRLARVAQALTAVGALDVATGQDVLADFAVAVGARQHSDPGPLLLTRPAVSRGRLYARVRPGTGGGPAEPGPAEPGPAGPGPAGGERFVPLGLTAPFRHEDTSGELHLLSYAHTSAGARFTITWRTRSPVGRGLMGRGFESPVFPRLFTVADDRGRAYRLDFRFTDSAGEIRLHPDPPDDVRWLEFSAPGQEPVRIAPARVRARLTPRTAPGRRSRRPICPPGSSCLRGSRTGCSRWRVTTCRACGCGGPRTPGRR